jgi:tetratricopeptide (TPR) repeat protein
MNNEATPGNRPRYWAFISYNHADRRWADWLHRALERYRLPPNLVGKQTRYGSTPRRLAPIFLDRVELAATSDLDAEITTALRESSALIVVCSPAAARSERVAREIELFKSVHGAARILTLIVAGRPNVRDRGGDPAEECFPEALRSTVSRMAAEDADERIDPLAADLRPGRGGSTEALIKLVAGVLGLNLDQLRQRDAQRRKRRWAAITATATLGMLMASALGAYAWKARNVALEAQARAERAARTSEATVNFVVDIFKVADPSESRSAAITAREILDRGAARLDSELGDEPAVRGTLLRTIGHIYGNLGSLEQSQSMLDEALATAQSQSPPDPLAVARTKAALAGVLVKREEYTRSERLYLEALAAFEADPRLRKDAVRARGDLGLLYWSKGDYDQARQTGDVALAMAKEVFGSRSPEVALISNDLALAIRDAGDIEQALVLLQQALDICRDLYGTEHMQVAMVEMNLGFTLIWAYRYADALAHLERAVSIYERTVGPNHPSLAIALQGLGSALENLGEHDRAIATLERSLAVERAAKSDQTIETARTMHYLSTAYVSLEQYGPAVVYARDAARLSGHLRGETSRDYGNALSHLGYVLHRAGQIDEAILVKRRAFSIDEPYLKDNPNEMASMMLSLADLLCARSPSAEGVSLAQRAVAARDVNAPDWAKNVGFGVVAYCDPDRSQGTDNERALLSAIEVLQRDRGPDARHTRDMLRRAVRFYEHWERREDAERFRGLLQATAPPKS